MNINMNNKYLIMHTDVLDICAKYDIRLISGIRVTQEIADNMELHALKDFLLLPEDMVKFRDCCEEELRDKGYLLEAGTVKGGAVCKIYRTDMLATTVSSLMSNPGGKHCPQFIIRELTVNGDDYNFTANGKLFSISRGLPDNLEKTAYMGGYVYVLKNTFASSNTQGYTLFNADCMPEEFINEAKKRGYLSKNRVSRFEEYNKWKKESRNIVEKKYREYQEILLGLKQP